MEPNATEKGRQYATNKFRKHHGADRVEEVQGPAAGKNVQRPWGFAQQPDGCPCLPDPSLFQWTANSLAQLRE